ncbi:sugar transport protein MST7-like [Papaver somniferum]|uniref:sugar transport protein MST7-like n=1 Tax=Papaver somniferum TaxID=3469 RepID=UPI000E6F9E0F|nr:sugar transport protein MST7-like [Papaver somniferum]
MRANIEKSDKKISLIFPTACFVGITSAFLIGRDYVWDRIRRYANQFLPETYNGSVAIHGILISCIPATLYWGIFATHIRRDDFSRLDMRRHMIWSGALVFMGSVVFALATNIFNYVMHVIGPMLYACGFGLMYQGAQVYMSEMGFAHRNYLASLNIAFKIMIAIGIFVANLVSCSTNSIKDGQGWRVSIGIAAIPAITTIRSFLLPDTPMSMIKLGKFDDAKQLLEHLHGTNDGGVWAKEDSFI